MKKFIKSIFRLIKPLIDILLSPFTLIGAVYFLFLKRIGLRQLRVSRAIFNAVGMFPIIDHYYEPLFNPRHLSYPLDRDRSLPGINFNEAAQLDLLSRFHFNEELKQIPLESTGELTYHFHNGSYESGDGEFLYNMLRLHKPRNIIEIGCGLSTLMIQRALTRNLEENTSSPCKHICVEPYEMSWLEKLPVEVKRSRVEDLPMEFFSILQSGDILFIDSSHVVRPQGDVVFEYLQLLPLLKPGVIVHVHDVFTPKDYPREWVVDDVKIWTEQYLLEAFLTHNHAFEIIGAVNFLHHHHREALAETAPVLAVEPDREPGAIWIRKIA